MELIKSGFDLDNAVDLAGRETAGRARVSLQHGINEALRANLTAFLGDDGEWRFFLIQTPSPKST